MQFVPFAFVSECVHQAQGKHWQMHMLGRKQHPKKPAIIPQCASEADEPLILTFPRPRKSRAQIFRRVSFA